MLSFEWKDYIEVSNSWISFYAWKKKNDPPIVHMVDAKSSSAHKNSWTTGDGTKIETTSTFPPYKGILLGEAGSSTKFIPLVLKDDFSLGIDGRI